MSSVVDGCLALPDQ